MGEADGSPSERLVPVADGCVPTCHSRVVAHAANARADPTPWCLHAMAMCHSYVITSGASAAVIIAAAAELPILVMPPFVGDDLVRANAAPNVITPASLRRVLATSKHPALSHPSQGVLVLQFCLSDILKPGAAAAFGADEFAKRVRKAVKQLSGLPLIPTAAGTLAHVR